MKRYNNLYEKISNIENIRLAHKNARKGKKHYSEVKMVDNNAVNSVMSYYGWMKHCDCKQLFTKYIDNSIQSIVSKNCELLKQKNPLKEVLI